MSLPPARPLDRPNPNSEPGLPPPDMQPLPATGGFTLVPGHPYRVSLKLKNWSPGLAAAARKTLKSASSTLYDYAAMTLEYQTRPSPSYGPVLLFGGGVKLTDPGQTVTWDFQCPLGPAPGTPVYLTFGYGEEASGTMVTSTNALKIPGTIAAES